MRPSAWTPIAISALAHVAFVVGAIVVPVAKRPPEANRAPVIELVSATPEPADVLDPPPVEVAVLDAAQSAAIASVPTPIAQRATRTEVATGGAATTELATGGPRAPGTPGTHTSLFDMRRGARPDLTLPDAKYDDLDHVPAGTTPEKDLHTGQLAPAGGGTYRSEQGSFVAHVDQDGHVKLKNTRNFHIHVALPDAKAIGDALQAWYDTPNKPTGTIAAPGKREVVSRIPRIDDANGGSTLEGNKGPAPSEPTIAIAGGGFDVTDALMRRHGVDPYASKKLAFMDATRDERAQIGQRHRTQQLAQVSQLMKRNLDRVWATVASPTQRKHALFELWDECVESGSDELGVAGTAARNLVIGFIRAHLPLGDADAFTSDEIAALNRRKASKAPFAPYE